MAEGMTRLKDLLIGQWGLVAISEDRPKELTIFTYGSPILVGFGDQEVYVASETIAFQNYTKEYFSTENGEIITLSLETLSALKDRIKQANRLISIDAVAPLKLRPHPPHNSFYE